MQRIEQESELQELNLIAAQFESDIKLIEKELINMKLLVANRWKRILHSDNLVEVQELNIVLMLFEESIPEVKARILAHLKYVQEVIETNDQNIIPAFVSNLGKLKEELGRLVKSVINLKQSYNRLIRNTVL